jgi:hypothetical protein
LYLIFCVAYFSIYAFKKLKKELDNIKSFSFLFNSPTFLKENKQKKEEKKFYIPNFIRERTLAGSKFEIRLRNSLSKKAIAKECKKWIEKKGKFKSLTIRGNTNPGFFIESKKKALTISFITLQTRVGSCRKSYLN